MMTPEDTAFVLTSASSRGGVPSAKMRLPVPNRTGKTSRQISPASSCSSSPSVSVELPQTNRSGPSFALMWRTPLDDVGSEALSGPQPRLSGLWVATYFVAAFRLSAIRLFPALGQ